MNLKRVIFKVLILISTLYAMIRMWHWKIGFTYFTQLSNLYAALVVGIQLVQCLRGRERRTTAAVKFTATVSVLMTFLVYLFVLAPMMPGGLIAAYAQDGWASLCLHILTPVFTLADFGWNDTHYRWGFEHALLATLPPIAYFLMILALGRLGMQWHSGMAAPYMFLNYAAPCGWFGFMPETMGATTLGIGVFYVMLALLGVFLLIGGLLARLSRRR